MQGKDVVLIMGHPKVGKSLTLHYLAGSKIIDEVVDGIPVLTARCVPGSEL